MHSKLHGQWAGSNLTAIPRGDLVAGYPATTRFRLDPHDNNKLATPRQAALKDNPNDKSAVQVENENRQQGQIMPLTGA